jgi:FixJ family two-component response regulator
MLSARENMSPILGSSSTIRILDICLKTVEPHRANIMRKLRLRSTSDLVRYPIRNKIVQA